MSDWSAAEHADLTNWVRELAGEYVEDWVCDQIATAWMQDKARVKRQQWISCDDSLPDIGTTALGVSDHWPSVIIPVMRVWLDDGWSWSSPSTHSSGINIPEDYEPDEIDVSHWRPMPEPPHISEG